MREVGGGWEAGGIRSKIGGILPWQSQGGCRRMCSSLPLAERNDGEREERVVGAQKASGSQVEACETSSDAESATGGLKVRIASVRVCSQKDKSDPEQEDQDKQRDRASCGCDLQQQRHNKQQTCISNEDASSQTS